MSLFSKRRRAPEPAGSAGEAYHRWYYDARVWRGVSWLGVPCLKSVADMWNYQEIIWELRPSVVIEFGTCHGGSALYFANLLAQLGGRRRVLTVDITHELVAPALLRHPGIDFVLSSSTAAGIPARIEALRRDYPGPAFAILDGDHSMAHVLSEMELLRPLLTAGD